MYVIFVILFQNYEKAIHAHNFRLFWKGLCFNYLISTLWLFQVNLFWVGKYSTFILEEELIQKKQSYQRPNEFSVKM